MLPLRSYNEHYFQNGRITYAVWLERWIIERKLRLEYTLYLNNERCSVGTSLELRSRNVHAADNNSLGCCWHNTLPTLTDPEYIMTKQLCIKHLYYKIRSKHP